MISTALALAALLTALPDTVPESPADSAQVEHLRAFALTIRPCPLLLHLDLPHRPPRVSPARGPPQAELHLDQSPAFDLAAPEPIPEYEFDQSHPDDWDA